MPVAPAVATSTRLHGTSTARAAAVRATTRLFLVLFVIRGSFYFRMVRCHWSRQLLRAERRTVYMAGHVPTVKAFTGPAVANTPVGQRPDRQGKPFMPRGHGLR